MACLLQAQSLESPHTSDSFHAWHVEQVAADIKESICRVSDTAFDAEANANIPTVDYEVRPGLFTPRGPRPPPAFHPPRPVSLVVMPKHSHKMFAHEVHPTPPLFPTPPPFTGSSQSPHTLIQYS